MQYTLDVEDGPILPHVPLLVSSLKIYQNYLSFLASRIFPKLQQSVWQEHIEDLC